MDKERKYLSLQTDDIVQLKIGEDKIWMKCMGNYPDKIFLFCDLNDKNKDIFNMDLNGIQVKGIFEKDYTIYGFMSEILGIHKDETEVKLVLTHPEDFDERAKRKYERIPVSIYGKLRYYQMNGGRPNNFERVSIKDLSINGVFCIAPKNIKNNFTQVSFILPDGSKIGNIDCKIMRKVLQPEKPNLIGLGMKFILIDEESLQSIKFYIADQTSRRK